MPKLQKNSSQRNEGDAVETSLYAKVDENNNETARLSASLQNNNHFFTTGGGLGNKFAQQAQESQRRGQKAQEEEKIQRRNNVQTGLTTISKIYNAKVDAAAINQPQPEPKMAPQNN